MKMKRRLPKMALTAIALVMSVSMLAQQRVISGRVSDANNQPLPGATVSVKGKSNSVITNERGAFRITAASGDILVFSFVGYEGSETRVRQENTVDIILK